MPPEPTNSSLTDVHRRARLKRAKGAAAKEFLLIVVLASVAAVAMVMMGPTPGTDPISAVAHMRY